MKINSNYSDLELCEYMIKNMSDDDLKNLTLENNNLRIKCGAFDKKNLKYEREKSVNAAITLSKSNKALRESIISIWELESTVFYKDIHIDNIEDVKRFIKKDLNSKEMFLLAMLLWEKSSSELNDYGDKIFDNCRLNKYKSEKEKSTMKDTSNLLSMNLADCIDAINNYDNKINEYEEKLKAKDEIIKELREQLMLNGGSKELKKEINKIGKTIQKSNNDFKTYSDDITKVVGTLKVELTDLKKEVNKQAINIDSNNKLLVNELSKKIKDFQNTIMGLILDDNKRLIKDINETINKHLENIRDTSKEEKDKSINLDGKRGKIENNTNNFKGDDGTGVQKFSKELENLLEIPELDKNL